MASRIELQEKLEEILGSRTVYFQPPESRKLEYPCFIYNLASGRTKRADNNPYGHIREYTILLITKNPDNDLIDEMVYAFPMIRIDRTYAKDNLNHYVYSLYY